MGHPVYSYIINTNSNRTAYLLSIVSDQIDLKMKAGLTGNGKLIHLLTLVVSILRLFESKISCDSRISNKQDYTSIKLVFG